MARVPKETTNQNERHAWHLRTARFYTLAQIADELEVDESTVCRMLQRVEKRLAKQFETRAVEIKARQTVQLEHIAQEAYLEWERSKLPGETERVVDKGSAGTKFDEERQEPVEVGVVEIMHETRGRIGEAALLNQMRGAFADIRKIWGLDAPVKSDVTSGGAPFKAYAGVDIDAV